MNTSGQHLHTTLHRVTRTVYDNGQALVCRPLIKTLTCWPNTLICYSVMARTGDRLYYKSVTYLVYRTWFSSVEVRLDKSSTTNPPPCKNVISLLENNTLEYNICHLTSYNTNPFEAKPRFAPLQSTVRNLRYDLSSFNTQGNTFSSLISHMSIKIMF